MASIVITDQVTKIPALWGTDVDNAVYNYLSGVAGTNTITATGPVGLAAYAAGLKFRFIPAATNTGATTVNITGTGALGARNIFMNGTALTGGELVIGQQAEIVDDGTRFQIINPFGNRLLSSFTKRKTADESVTSSTVLQDDDHLTFQIGANEEWTANFFLDVGAALATTGIKVAVTVPSGATLNAIATAKSWGGADRRTTTSGTALDFTVGGIWTFNDPAFIPLSAWILNGSTIGSVTLQFAQSTSNGTAVTVRKGSFLQATRVA